MAQKFINTSTPNDGLGDALRDAFNDTNANFTELYSIKVDKVPGQGLSDNNLTDELVAKILSNEENAQENIQSDWLQNDNTEDDYIKNKPTSVDFDINYPVMLSFDFPKNNKNVINGLHGSLLINNSEDGIVLNPTTDITGDGGVSKVLAAVLAGTDVTGSFTITGTSVDRETGVETVGDSEVVAVDGLSTGSTTPDANGNPVYSYDNTYISSKWWKGTLVFSTTDLDITEVRFAQIAFEQFNDSDLINIETLDATYIIDNNDAELDAYLYAVEVDEDNKCSVSVISELHHESGLLADNSYRRRKGGINKVLNGNRSGVFVDLFMAPLTKEYFTSFVLKVWGTVASTGQVYINNTSNTDTITYGETLAAGDIVYLAPNGKYYKADNTDVSTSTTQIRLILEGGLADDSKTALVKGKYSVTGLTAGNEYLGINGGITSTPPTGASEVVRILSTAISTNERYFNPDVTWISGDGAIINGVNVSPESDVTLSDAWSVGGLDVRAYATNAPILDQFYTGAAQTITVNPAPTTVDYLRYIAIVMDVNGIITAQDGAEGTAVLPPAVDLDNYYLIRYLLISYGDTEPTDEDGNPTTTYNILYDENGTEAGGESNVTVNNAAITINEPASPFGGVGIRGINVPRYGAYMYFTYTTKKLFSALTGLRFNFKLDTANRRNRIYIYFYNGTVRVGKVLLRDGDYGFTPNSSLGQSLYIPKENLQVINTEFDSVRMFVYTTSGNIPGYWVDDVELINAYVYNPNLGQPQKQSDWDQTDVNAVDYIKNKPANVVESVVAGTNVTVDNTDPKNPIVNSSGGGGGGDTGTFTSADNKLITVVNGLITTIEDISDNEALLFINSPVPNTEVNSGDALNINVTAEEATAVLLEYKNISGAWVTIGSAANSGNSIWIFNNWSPTVAALSLRATATYSDLTTKAVENSLLSVILYDTFTDTNGTLLANHTPDLQLGANWNIVSGDWEIQSNELQINTADTNLHFAYVDIGQPNTILSFVINSFDSSNTTQFILRYTDDSNHILFLINQDGKITIGKRVGGVFTSYYVGSNGDYTPGLTCEIRLIDNTLNVVINNLPIPTIDVSDFATGNKHGVARGGANITPHIDNFKIIPIGLQPINNDVSYTATKNGTLILSKNFMPPTDQNGIAGHDIYTIGTTNYMVFAARDSSNNFVGLTYATSPTNDPHNWTRYNGLILTGGSESIADCSTYWDGSEIYVVYSDRFTGNIHYAKGSDLLNLTKQGVILAASGGTYYRHPALLVENGVFYLYLDVRYFQAAGEFGVIGLFSGNSLNTLGNYKEVLSNLGYDFEQCDVGAPAIRYNSVNEYYELLFVGYPGGGVPYIHEIGLAISKNPLGKFERVSTVPLIANGGSGAIDEIFAIDPTWLPNTDIVYYTADAYDGFTYATLT